jgi:hypothetical protein
MIGMNSSRRGPMLSEYIQKALEKAQYKVLEEWLVLKIRDRDSIPMIEGVGIQIKEVLAA